MRVLDVGSGGGDAALVAAELVGEAGEVVGVDSNRSRRRRRSGSRGRPHKASSSRSSTEIWTDCSSPRSLTRLSADTSSCSNSGSCGNGEKRSKARAAGRRRRVSRNRLERGPFTPRGAESSSNATIGSSARFERVGPIHRWATICGEVFVRAGLSPPSMALRALIQGPSERVGYIHMIAELANTLAPVMEEQGVIARGEFDPRRSEAR